MRNPRSLTTALFGVAIVLNACSDSPNLPTGAADRALESAPTSDKAYGDEAEGRGRDDVKIVRASGDIFLAVGTFRELVGAPNNLALRGEQESGRREINWDGVPAAVTNVDNFPGDFFNVNSPRGVLFTTNGTGFRISDNGYTDVNAAYADEFVAFSPKKLFVARGSTVTDVQFVVAGSNTQALVNGFGSVFEDVGRASSTTIEYFDINGKRLLRIKAPRRSDDRGISFAGAVFDSPIVARVRITAGDTPLGADVLDNVKGAGKKRDLVAMDDFIYGEPHAPKGSN